MPHDATESVVGEVVPLQMSCSNTVENECSSDPGSIHARKLPPLKQLRYGGSLSRPHTFPQDYAMKIGYAPSGHGSLIVSKHSYKPSQMLMHRDRENPRLDQGDEQLHRTDDEDSKLKECDALVTSKCDDNIQQPNGDDKNCSSSMYLEPMNVASLPDEEAIELLNAQLRSRAGSSFCPSPQGSFYTATQYMEAKESFTCTELSECESSLWKTGISSEIGNSCDFTESRRTFIGSVGSDVSNDGSSNSFHNSMYKRHRTNDKGWEAIQAVRASNNGVLELKNFRIFKRLGHGDIGTVHLAELKGTGMLFAVKVMDKETLESRKKTVRAQTEREILQSLDHPFLPTLYTHFETETLSFLVMEFCPGGDLHVLQQKQPGKFFPEDAARFYLAEVLLALEYLHMLGIIYRDLKPENILVREDGHIMLSDFDLSLRCAVHPTLVKTSNPNMEKKSSRSCVQPACIEPFYPNCIRASCLSPRFLGSKHKKDIKPGSKAESNNQVIPLPEVIVEPTNARSMSFVGTHEYLAPEIIKGEGHGSAVDWWTFGIFLYELLFGTTPFKGTGNRATLFNVVGQPLRFPESPTVSFAARDLIRGLLVKEPQQRLAYRRGATEIKQHPFFQSVNWALIRCAIPPEVPTPFTMDDAGEPARDAGKAQRDSRNFCKMDFY